MPYSGFIGSSIPEVGTILGTPLLCVVGEVVLAGPDVECQHWFQIGAQPVFVLLGHLQLALGQMHVHWLVQLAQDGVFPAAVGGMVHLYHVDVVMAGITPIINKPGLAQVGAISEAQKYQKDFKVSSILFYSTRMRKKLKNSKIFSRKFFFNFFWSPVSRIVPKKVKGGPL